MKVGIIGASGAGLYVAIFLKKKHTAWEIHVFDRMEKAGKKLLATGNGRCNLLNRSAKPEDYDHPDFVRPFFQAASPDSMLETLRRIGVQTELVGDLAYPSTFSASSHVFYLTSLAEGLGIQFHFAISVLDYSSAAACELITDQGRFSLDRLIFAVGGKSQKNLGSDGSLFPVLQRHGYEIAKLRPGLAPIVVSERVKELQGIRHNAEVSLYQNGERIHQEKGEVLFKDDGLSGIVVFNAQFEIMKRSEKGSFSLELDLFPNQSEEQLRAAMTQTKSVNPNGFLAAYLQKPLADYVRKACKTFREKPANESEIIEICHRLKHLTFEYQKSYPFESSQVTLGGIALSEVNESLGSRKEPNVFFAGEMLDVAGRCGGYNLTWCLASALAIANAL